MIEELEAESNEDQVEELGTFHFEVDTYSSTT